MKKMHTGLAILLSMILLLGAFGCSQPAPAPPAKSTAAPSPTPAAASPAAPATAADFYKGKALSIQLNSTPGSTNDMYARLAASYLSDIMGVRLGVENKTAGAGYPLFNEFANSKPDGLTVLWLPQSIWLYWMFNKPEVKYDVTKLEYLGSINDEPAILGVGAKSPYNTVDALKKGKNLKFSVTSAEDSLSISQVIAIDALGLDAKVITGFQGSSGKHLAVVQGEVDGEAQMAQSMTRYEQAGETKNLLQINLKRDKNWPNLPCLAELSNMSELNKKLLTGLPPNIKMLIGQPGTPKDRVKFLEDSFAALFANKNYQQAVAQVAGMWLGAMSAEDLRKIAALVVEAKSSGIVAEIDPLIKKYTK